MSSDLPEFRRNLSLAACEPCRKAKIGCNHAHPCGRCAKRGLQHLCVYRTAEDKSEKATGSKDVADNANSGMEQRLKQIERSLQNLQRQLLSEGPSKSRKRRRGTVEESPPEWTQHSSSVSIQPVETSEATWPSLEAQTDDSDQEDFQTLDNDDQSFVGPNSSTTALQEFISTREQFKGILDEFPPEGPQLPSTLPPSALVSGERRFRQSRLELGESVLRGFPPKILCDVLLSTYFDVFYLIRPVVPRHWAEKALEDVFQIEGFMQPKTAENISNIAAIVDYNSFKELSVPSNPLSVNWNIIGTLTAMFAIAAYTAPHLLDVDALQFHTGITPEEGPYGFSFKMHNLVGICWQLSNPFEKADESSVLLLYFYIWVHIVFGEYTPIIQHLHASLISAAAVTGLHREAPQNEHDSDSIERRRTLYAAIYHFDKATSTYNGRPPLMFRRFSNTLLPSGTSEGDKYLRGQFTIAQAREEVLELLLTSASGTPMERISNTQRVVLDRYDSISSELKYDWNNPMGTTKAYLNAHRIILYLFSLENSFILQSVLAKKVKALPELKLLKVSIAMFSAVVRTWENVAHLGNFAFVLSWLLTTYAFASAGIIFSTILQEHTTSGGNSDLLPRPLISKSFHLQMLRQFLDALASIQPTDPHFTRCKKAFRIFSKVNEVLGGIVPTNPLNRMGTGVDVCLPPHVADQTSDTASSEYSEFGLNNRLNDFGTLPWLDHVWTDWDFGESFTLPSEQTNATPFPTGQGQVGGEYWDGMV